MRKYIRTSDNSLVSFQRKSKRVFKPVSAAYSNKRDDSSDDDIIYLEEGVMQLVEDILQSDYNLSSEPSVQSGIGEDSIYDTVTGKCVGTIDYQDELNYARKALATNNDDFEAAARDIADWIVEMVE